MCCSLGSADGLLRSDPVRDAVRRGSSLESSRIQAEPGRDSSSGQEQPERVGPEPAAAAAEGQEQRLGGGPGVQPGGAARHRAPLPEAGLVQDAAAETDHPRGGLHQPDHHQPLLLRTVQLLLHPEARAQGRGRVPVVLVLQTQALHHHDLHPQLPRPAAADPEKARAAGQTVSLHLHRAGLSDGRARTVSANKNTRETMEAYSRHLR